MQLANEKKKKRRTMIYKTIHKKLQNEQHQLTKNLE